MTAKFLETKKSNEEFILKCLASGAKRIFLLNNDFGIIKFNTF